MATGNVLCRFNPPSDGVPSSNYATLGTRNTHAVLLFDASTEESAYWEDVLPDNYAGGGLTVDVYWTASSATSGDVVWGGSIERQAAGGTDQDSDSFATEQTATGTANATSGIITKTSLTFTDGANMDSLAAGEPFRFKLARKAADAGNTMVGDAEVLRVAVKET